MRQGRASEATEAAFLPYGKNLLFFAIWQKSLFIAGCVQASVTHLVCLLAVVCRRFFFSQFGLREAYMTDFHKPGVCRNGRARANAWDLFQFRPFRVARGRRVSIFGGFADAVCVLFL